MSKKAHQDVAYLIKNVDGEKTCSKICSISYSSGDETVEFYKDFKVEAAKILKNLNLDIVDPS